MDVRRKRGAAQLRGFGGANRCATRRLGFPAVLFVCLVRRCCRSTKPHWYADEGYKYTTFTGIALLAHESLECMHTSHFSPGTSLFFIPGVSAGIVYCSNSKPDSAAISHQLMAAFSHVVIMLKKGMIVKEPARRIRYSRRVDDIRLEGHDAALFI